MISRLHRFHGHNSLNFVYQKGETVRGPLCSIKYVKNDRRSNYRLAVVVSKKISKSAVTRNRIRRRLYETVRLKESLILGPYDIVMTVFSEELTKLPIADIEKMVFSQLKQAKIIAK